MAVTTGWTQPPGAPGSAAAKDSIPALTGLRFFAALWVLLIHYRPLVDYPPIIRDIAEHGRLGVGLFFVLSGFVLTYNYYDWFQKDARKLPTFAYLRAARILPMYFTALFVGTVITLVFWRLPIDHLGTTYLPSALPTHLYVVSWFANLGVVHGFVPLEVFHIWNGPSWSISAEAFFYLLFPLTIASLGRFCRDFRRTAIAAFAFYLVEITAFLLVVGVLLTAGLADIQRGVLQERVAYWSPFLRVWEFLIGCTVGILYLHLGAANASTTRRLLQRKAVTNGLAALVLAVIGLLVFGARGESDLGVALGWLKWYVLFTPAFAALIMVLAIGPSFVATVLEQRPIVLLGDASYSLYMIHAIPLVVLLGLQAEGNPIPLGLSLATMGGTVIVSVLCFRFIEAPARRALRRKRWPRVVSDLWPAFMKRYGELRR